MEETLGKRIVTNRKRMGMTQDQLAERLGVTAQAVSKWENDQSCPDIAMLPKLAEIFGTTTDSLLGIQPESHTKEAENNSPDDNDSEHLQFRNGNWEVKVDASRRGGIFFATLVLLIGTLYLVTSILQLNVGLWDIIWPSSLLIIGLYGIYPKFSFVSLGFLLFGGFFLIGQFFPIPFQLNNGIIIAVIILLAGGGLLLDAMRRPKKSAISFNSGNNGTQTPEYSFSINQDSFEFNAAFSDRKQAINMPVLKNGMINTSFGDYEIDLSGVRELALQCRLEANTSFGDLTIWVPSKYEVRCATSAAFASVEVEGKPDAVPAGIIQLNANASFGQITIEYI